jgi:hypothetical protein
MLPHFNRWMEGEGEGEGERERERERVTFHGSYMMDGAA